MSFVNTPTRTFSIGLATTLGPYLRMKIASTGIVSLAGATDIAIGTLDTRVIATDTRATLRLHTAQGTQKMVANAAVAIGAKVFSVANGKVGATSTGAFLQGIAVSAAAADGDVIEVIPILGTIAQ